MKYVVLTLLLPLVLQAQSPVITRMNYFEIGDSAFIYQKFDTSLWSISVGPSGANVTWDFSDMDFNHPSVIVDTLLFVSPVGTPFYPTSMSADYSQANIAMLRNTEDFSPNDEDYNYYYADDDSLVFLGHWAAGGGTELWEDHFDNSMKELQFPMSFGDAFTDSFQRYFYDMSGSDAHYVEGIITVTADAFGTMITPDGTALSNVLRLHTKTVATDSNAFFGINTYMQHKYSWYDESKKGFVLTFYMSVNDTTAVETAEYQKQTNVITSIDEIRLGGNTLHVFPNPANEVATIELNSASKIETLKLYNALGQLVKSFDGNGKAKFEIDVNGLVEGMYFLEVVDATGSKYRRKLIVR